MTTDSNNNIYVAGSASSDALVVKYSPDGTKQWAKLFGTSGREYSQGIHVDEEFNIYLAGSASWVNESELMDAFVFKINKNSNLLWMKKFRIGENIYNRARGVLTDSNGNFYVSGITNPLMDSNENFDENNNYVFLTKFNDEGNQQWTQHLKSNFGDNVGGPTIGNKGDIYIAGTSKGNLDGNSTDDNEGNAFVAKYNSEGTKQWIKQFGPNGADTSGGRGAIDDQDNIYVAGSTNGVFIGNTSAGGYDIYIAKLDKNGVLSTTSSGTVSENNSTDNVPSESSIDQPQTNQESTDNINTTILEGTWVGNCYVNGGQYSRETTVYSKNIFTTDSLQYSDDQCTQRSSVGLAGDFRANGTFTIENGSIIDGKQLTKVNSVMTIIYSEGLVALLLPIGKTITGYNEFYIDGNVRYSTNGGLDALTGVYNEPTEINYENYSVRN